jgi:RimJ/RimL family protein N-acetyltransferase
MHTFETERLVLRRLTRADEEIHPLIYRDPRVCGRWFAPLRTLEEVRDWLVHRTAEAVTSGLGYWAVVQKTDLTLLGLVGLQAYVPWWLARAEGDPFNRIEVELSYALGYAYWGQGYATEAGAALVGHAFNCLRLRRLLNAVDAENTRSVGVMRRLGFRLHATAEGIVGVLDNAREGGLDKLEY